MLRKGIIIATNLKKMIKILANDGIDQSGLDKLLAAGYHVETSTIPQEELALKLNDYDAILVRSATQVRKELIDACPNLKLIGRGGVGMDNIDVAYARGKGKTVVNTPMASTQSVAELVFAHLFTAARFLHQSNRQMPTQGESNFGGLKKKYSNGMELSGKTLGIVGFGSIGQAVAKMALGLGMQVLVHTREPKEKEICIELGNGQTCTILIRSVALDDVLSQSDFITLHIPFGKGEPAVINAEAFSKMKNGVGIVNTARGGVINEDDLLVALNSGKVAFAGMDVFENEPTPRVDLLQHDKVSLTPHIGGSTVEGQLRVWEEMADQLIDFFG